MARGVLFPHCGPTADVSDPIWSPCGHLFRRTPYPYTPESRTYTHLSCTVFPPGSLHPGVLTLTHPHGHYFRPCGVGSYIIFAYPGHNCSAWSHSRAMSTFRRSSRVLFHVSMSFTSSYRY